MSGEGSFRHSDRFVCEDVGVYEHGTSARISEVAKRGERKRWEM